jgi:putative (di)nucleoside polyphosphate hydrolase
MNIDEAIKDKVNIPYRSGVIGLILNKENQVLIAQMNAYKENEWRFPGGGIDEGEEPKEALLRELREELGSEEFEVIKESRYKAKFDWPDESIRKRYEKRGELYRGQEQRQFLVKFIGDISNLKPDPNELRQVKWVSLKDLPDYFIFPGQWELTKKVIEEFNLI